ncbi:unnamed protein product [Heterobilharzia americana]|nr:unnamed protein product [Heterobilharzia americana]
MSPKEKWKRKFPELGYTSTPRRSEYCLATNSTDFTQDTGYGTSSSIVQSPSGAVDIGVFPDSFDEDRCSSVRQSLRGKQRVDILLALMSFEKSGYILEKILRYLEFNDYLAVLCVSKAWNSLSWRFPQIFSLNKKHAQAEGNHVKQFARREFSRKPLSMVNLHGSFMSTDRPYDFSTKEFLHACPICSGVAFYRPSEWPNRLHCQASGCGVSVCYDCQREHSPSEKCHIKSSSSSKRLSPIKVPTSPARSPRSRDRITKTILRRL